MSEISNIVDKIIQDVRKNKDDAVVRYTKKFDGLKNYSKNSIKRKVGSIALKDKDFIKAIKIAINNVRKFHKQEFTKIKRVWYFRNNNGEILGQKILPVESVGIYVPGGKGGFNYISSLIMSYIPAQVAQVRNIVITTPPKNITNYFLYTANLLGIRCVYAVGGVQAIAAMAYGTETVPKVNLIVGPGNKWVTEAKRQVFGEVGIDILAGPSEVVVFSDEKSNVDEVVYELLAQVEHDIEAKSTLISTSEKLLAEVENKVELIFHNSNKQITYIYEKSINNVISIINEIAPEHLTLLSKNKISTKKVLSGVKNAGAIFWGINASAVFGDYICGPSHILPTAGAAKFSSGVSVMTFLKKISTINLAGKASVKLSKYVKKLADIEGMKFHSKRVDII